ncbi:MAG: pullulanase-type alpha-1,6-glucosidase [Spongiibacteraceae bacterium]|nr:pullulanase-type alpha-1,6-glucosidase [Spongiibacteraceae bacterium]
MITSYHSRKRPRLLSFLFSISIAGLPALLSPSLQAAPSSVTLVGSVQNELGCDSDWQPDCISTQLIDDEDDGIWKATFTVPTGDWDYKVLIDQSWNENYGANATAGGANISLSVDSETTVTFYYDNATHWIVDNSNQDIITVAGNFQLALGCSGDWQADCLQSWLQDPDGDGIYTFTTEALLAGDYELKVIHNENWIENYGANGVLGGANITFTVEQDNETVSLNYHAQTHILTVGDAVEEGNLSLAKAYWLSQNTIAWNVPSDANVQLHYNENGDLSSSASGVSGGQSITLTYDSGGLNAELQGRFPHLASLPVFKISSSTDLALLPQILKQQIAVSAQTDAGVLIDATALQPAGVLDDLYGDAINSDSTEILGVSFQHKTPSIRVWAPTAKSVSLLLFEDSDPDSLSTAYAMTEDPATGIWSVTGSKSWNRLFYLFDVEVFMRSTAQVENNQVTDPYTFSASVDGVRSQLVNLNDADLKPKGWHKLRKPNFNAPEDAAMYELHVRDFSISDESVNEALRGTFMAFTQSDSKGMKHLRRLAKAGLSHLHLLPSFDCATIKEDPEERQQIIGDLSIYAPDSDQQQAAVEAIRNDDAFNWCYDPFHYTLPEGSYATDADGVTRIREFREMVAALSRTGLRVVMDVVYNHTNSSLQGDKSVLDKIVPNYYHRLDAEGHVETSSCCSNTASENAMMEKLMLDSLKTWATEYKVDGFRFDLMGHHSKDNIVKARDLLQALTVDNDGVDGSQIYIYGEGWNFGEVANDARFVQATQANMAGTGVGESTGVGSFNDRFRDAIRGGSPFDTGITHISSQGFISGLYYDPNAENSGSNAELTRLLTAADQIRVALAGSLAAFTFVDGSGNTVSGADIDYGGQQTGYTSDPQETINYAAAHDNETLFDINQYKTPLSTSAEDRVRIQNMANSLVALSQGIPFFHAGQDMLRSKSSDRNSYDSGDWFNLLDFSYSNNGWARGLPPESDNSSSWDFSAPLLANANLAVESQQIKRASEHLREMLKIRKSSALFRLQDAQQIIERVSFHNTGPTQLPGLVAMRLTDETGINLDPRVDQIVVLFNANNAAQNLVIADTVNSEFKLHRVQRRSSDSVLAQSSFNSSTGEFTVPARSTVVFVKSETGACGYNDRGGWLRSRW